MPERVTDIYGGQSPRELPLYSLADAAHYLALPRSTVRAWSAGRPYRAAGEERFAKALVEPAQARPLMLSFVNVAELHVLKALRRTHKIALPAVRRALDYLQHQRPSPHPLVDANMQTDGVDLFIEHYGELVNLSKSGQLAMRDVLAEHLSRIEFDAHSLPIRLYPYTRDVSDAPRLVVMDPRVSFGRPVIAGTGIPTEVIYSRFRAGESIAELATDYGRAVQEIEEALRCEQLAA